MSRLPTGAREGIRASLPLVLGIVPFGLVAGIAAVEAGLSPVAAVGMSVVIYAGASQLAIVDLLRTDASLLVAVVAGVVINLRMLMYSASLAPYFQRYRSRWQAVLAYFLTDPVYALAISRYTDDEDDRDDGHERGRDAEEARGRDETCDSGRDDGDGGDGDHDEATCDGGIERGARGVVADAGVDADTGRDWYYLGIGVTIWAVWVAATAVGVSLGRGIPNALGVDFAVPLVFLALLVSSLEDSPTVAAGVAAGVTALAGSGLPYNLGLLVGTVVGIGVGLAVEGGSER
jgi:predicted branched-subunit amino acid permease